MDALYERAWTRFSREFRNFWTVGPGPHILGSLQKSKYCLPHMRTNMMQARELLDGHKAWNEFTVGSSKCVNCSLVRGWSRGGCRVWQEGVVGWINSTVTARWISSVG